MMELSHLPQPISFSSSSSFFLSFYLSIRHDSLRIRQVTQSSFDYIHIDCGSKNISGVVSVTRIQFIYIWFGGIEKQGSKRMDRNVMWRHYSAVIVFIVLWAKLKWFSIHVNIPTTRDISNFPTSLMKKALQAHENFNAPYELKYHLWSCISR